MAEEFTNEDQSRLDELLRSRNARHAAEDKEVESSQLLQQQEQQVQQQEQQQQPQEEPGFLTKLGNLEGPLIQGIPEQEGINVPRQIQAFGEMGDRFKSMIISGTNARFLEGLDELSGLSGGVVAEILGTDDFSGGYESSRDFHRDFSNKAKAKYPVESFAADIGSGSILSNMKFMQKLEGSKGTLDRMKAGGVEGMISALGVSEGDIDAVSLTTLAGGVFGAAFSGIAKSLMDRITGSGSLVAMGERLGFSMESRNLNNKKNQLSTEIMEDIGDNLLELGPAFRKGTTYDVKSNEFIDDTKIARDSVLGDIEKEVPTGGLRERALKRKKLREEKQTADSTDVDIDSERRASELDWGADQIEIEHKLADAHAKINNRVSEILETKKIKNEHGQDMEGTIGRDDIIGFQDDRYSDIIDKHTKALVHANEGEDSKKAVKFFHSLVEELFGDPRNPDRITLKGLHKKKIELYDRANSYMSMLSTSEAGPPKITEEVDMMKDFAFLIKDIIEDISANGSLPSPSFTKYKPNSPQLSIIEARERQMLSELKERLEREANESIGSALSTAKKAKEARIRQDAKADISNPRAESDMNLRIEKSNKELDDQARASYEADKENMVNLLKERSINNEFSEAKLKEQARLMSQHRLRLDKEIPARKKIADEGELSKLNKKSHLIFKYRDGLKDLIIDEWGREITDKVSGSLSTSSISFMKSMENSLRRGTAFKRSQITKWYKGLPDQLKIPEELQGSVTELEWLKAVNPFYGAARGTRQEVSELARVAATRLWKNIVDPRKSQERRAMDREERASEFEPPLPVSEPLPIPRRRTRLEEKRRLGKDDKRKRLKTRRVR